MLKAGTSVFEGSIEEGVAVVVVVVVAAAVVALLLQHVLLWLLMSFESENPFIVSIQKLNSMEKNKNFA